MAIRRRYRVTSMSIPAPELASPSRVHRTADPRAGLLVGATPKGFLPGKMLAAGRPPLDEYYNSLFTALGPQHWWPGRTQFEVIVGAILTQNTSWKNVERALAKLRDAGVFTPTAVAKAHIRSLHADSSVRLFPPEGASVESVCPVLAVRVSRVAEENVRYANA